MAEWSTYSLSSFLLFSPRTWQRLLELHNLDWWPLHLATIAGGGAILVLLQRPTLSAARVAVGLLAVFWLWVAWAFLLQRYATINWAATWFAAAFALEGFALLGVATLWRQPRPPAAAWPRRAGAGLLGFALVAMPLLAWLPGRTWTEAQVLGMMPDPTVVATLGVLLCLRPPAAGVLLLVPLAWSVVSGATLWAMGTADAALLPAAGAVTVALFARPRL